MPVAGSPDLGSAVPFPSGRVRRAFGGGPYVVEPSGCEVLTDAGGELLWQLDVVRSLVRGESRAVFSCTVGARYAGEEALAALRETDPGATVTAAVLTDWTFRATPTPMLATATDLAGPVPITSAGLGTGRLLTQLSLESGLLLEGMLRDGGSLWGTAEATLVGVSPRVPAVVRFDPAVLLGEILRDADASGALPYELLASFFRHAPGDLPIHLSEGVDDAHADAFAHTMADRIVARSGVWVPAQDPADAPVVRLTAGSPGTVTWRLSEPALVSRRLLLRVDLLGAARARAAEHGPDGLVTRRDLAAQPATGESRVTVLSMLPTPRAGVQALGVALEFPPYPPFRAQPRWATAELDGEDTVEVAVRLSPGEPLRYRATPFAVLADAFSTRRLDGATATHGDRVLRLAPGDFPVELVALGVSPALSALAVVICDCSFWWSGQAVRRRITLDTGLRGTAVAVPRDASGLRIDVVALPRDGSDEVVLGPFERGPVQLDLTSFPAYGPRQATVRCIFDDGTPSCAVTLLPAGVPDEPSTTTMVLLTPDEPARVHRWFAPSPFADGLRYRLHGGSTWSLYRPAGDELLLLSSELGRPDERREVVVRERAPLRREATVAGPVAESAVVPVARSPHLDPSDELVYARIDPPGGEGYVPRYQLDEQTVSGKREYRVAMGSTEAGSTLTVHLVATMPPAVAQQAPAATELPHTVEVELEFLMTDGAYKQLPFTDITREGAVVTAVATFATLAERDDVYVALTDPARAGWLEVRRLVDLLIPVPTPSDPGVSDVLDLGQLPIEPIDPGRVFVRPILVWPPQRFTLPPTKAVLPPERLVGPDRWSPAKTVDTLTDLTGDGFLVADASTRLTDLGTGLQVTRLPSSFVGETAAAPSARRLTGVPVTRGREIAEQELRSRVGLLRPRLDRLRPRDGVPFPPDRGPRPRPRPRPVATLPVPRISVRGSVADGGFTRYTLRVDNWQEFSDEFFTASPDLPACGLNANSSRTWAEILDAASGRYLYGFCALGAAQHLADLWFAVPDGTAPPAEVQLRLDDRRTGVSQVSTAVPTEALPPRTEPEPANPSWYPERHLLQQVVPPERFVFSPALHGYMFQGVTPGSGGSRLVRRVLPYGGRQHAYLQDASRPEVVYVFPDEFKIARWSRVPFTPLVTVRVTSSPDGRTTSVVVDYVVAPEVDAARLADAGPRLLADPRFGADSVRFQPFATTDVSFTVDRPTATGSVRERRTDAAVVLASALKDTLTMPLEDFRLLFDAMHGTTASLFLGHVDIGTGGGTAEVIPFTARMDDLAGSVLSYDATTAADGLLDVALTNCIESPVDVRTLGVAVVVQGDPVGRALVRDGLPIEGLEPGRSAVVRVEVQGVPSSPVPELTLDVTGVTVHPDPEAIWNSILDRSSVDYFRLVTVKLLTAVFDPLPGRESETIRAVAVEFQGGGTAELQPGDGSGTFVEATVRVDHPIDDVILDRPVSQGYRYTRTVIRADGTVWRDPEPTAGSADVLYLDVPR